jgi:hypothetical protein
MSVEALGVRQLADYLKLTVEEATSKYEQRRATR